MSDQKIEVYRQRYETFRHLDRLRWQMAQVLVAVLSAAALIFRTSPDGVGGAFWLFLGLAFVTIALVLNRITQGIARNGDVLKEFGAAIGDDHVPSASSGSRGVTNWLTVAIAVGGAGCLAFGLIELNLFGGTSD